MQKYCIINQSNPSTQLGKAYQQNYNSWDYFPLRCAEEVLKVLPNFCDALVLKFCVHQQLGFDYQNTNDPVLFWFDINLGRGKLENSDMMIREKSSEGLLYIHRSPIDTGNFWKTIKDYMKK